MTVSLACHRLASRARSESCVAPGPRSIERFGVLLPKSRISLQSSGRVYVSSGGPSKAWAG